MNDLIYITLIQLFVTWGLVGVMWFTQIVHYPLYKKVKEGFIEYERAHIRRTFYLIAPLMLIEAISAIFLLGFSEKPLIKFAVTNLIFLIFIWIFTFLFQITQHQKLSTRFSSKILKSLLLSNWIRTILWTSKGIVMGIYVYHFLIQSCRMYLERMF